MEASGQDYDNSGLSRKEYIFDVDQIGSGPVETMENWSGEGVGYRRAALIGRLKYDYAPSIWRKQTYVMTEVTISIWKTLGGILFRFSGMGCIRGKILERLGAEKDF